jgi:hypothetical protein
LAVISRPSFRRLLLHSSASFRELNCFFRGYWQLDLDLARRFGAANLAFEKEKAKEPISAPAKRLIRPFVARWHPQAYETLFGIAGRIPSMGIVLAATVAWIVGLVVLKSALVRIGRLPARYLPDSSSYLMVHAPLEKCLAVLFVALVISGLTAGIFRAWQVDSLGAAIFFVALAVPLGWMAFLNLLKQRNTIELTDSAISWRRGSIVTTIKWTEASGLRIIAMP